MQLSISFLSHPLSLFPNYPINLDSRSWDRQYNSSFLLPTLTYHFLFFFYSFICSRSCTLVANLFSSRFLGVWNKKKKHADTHRVTPPRWVEFRVVRRTTWKEGNGFLKKTTNSLLTSPNTAPVTGASSPRMLVCAVYLLIVRFLIHMIINKQ